MIVPDPKAKLYNVRQLIENSKEKNKKYVLKFVVELSKTLIQTKRLNFQSKIFNSRTADQLSEKELTKEIEDMSTNNQEWMMYLMKNYPIHIERAIEKKQHEENRIYSLSGYFKYAINNQVTFYPFVHIQEKKGAHYSSGKKSKSPFTISKYRKGICQHFATLNSRDLGTKTCTYTKNGEYLSKGVENKKYSFEESQLHFSCRVRMNILEPTNLLSPLLSIIEEYLGGCIKQNSMSKKRKRPFEDADGFVDGQLCLNPDLESRTL
jgi:hypothetical protein